MILKWIINITRIWTGFCILFILYFILGHLLSDDGGSNPFTSDEVFAFICFPMGVLLGLILSWFNHLIGGLITVISIIIFYLIMSNAMNSFWINFLAAPGLVHLIIGARTKGKS